MCEPIEWCSPTSSQCAVLRHSLGERKGKEVEPKCKVNMSWPIKSISMKCSFFWHKYTKYIFVENCRCWKILTVYDSLLIYFVIFVTWDQIWIHLKCLYVVVVVPVFFLKKIGTLTYKPCTQTSDICASLPYTVVSSKYVEHQFSSISLLSWSTKFNVIDCNFIECNFY